PTILGGYLGARFTGRFKKESLQRLVGATIALTGLGMAVEGVYQTLPSQELVIGEVVSSEVVNDGVAGDGVARGELVEANLTSFHSPLTPDIDFNRHIRSILSAKCFSCHGPDSARRKAHLRLDR